MGIPKEEITKLKAMARRYKRQNRSEGKKALDDAKRNKQLDKRLHRYMCKIGSMVKIIVDDPFIYARCETELTNLVGYKLQSNGDLPKSVGFVQNSLLLKVSDRELDAVLSSMGIMLCPRADVDAMLLLLRTKLTHRMYTKYAERIRYIHFT